MQEKQINLCLKKIPKLLYNISVKAILFNTKFLWHNWHLLSHPLSGSRGYVWTNIPTFNK